MMRKPCCEKNSMNKGAWSKQEDQKLIDYIHRHGEGSWHTLPKAAGLRRCGKSCRLRWINYLRPDLKRGSFADDEEDLIIRLHALLGNRWSLIAGRLPGRTANEVKNYWNSHLRKKLIKIGIDPCNHRIGPENIGWIMSQRSTNSISSAVSSSLNPRTPHMNSSCLNNKEKETNDLNSPEDNVVLSRDAPGLNLDLTIRIPSPSLHGVAGFEEPNPKLLGDLESANSPTLPLFT